MPQMNLDSYSFFSIINVYYQLFPKNEESNMHKNEFFPRMSKILPIIMWNEWQS